MSIYLKTGLLNVEKYYRLIKLLDRFEHPTRRGDRSITVCKRSAAYGSVASAAKQSRNKKNVIDSILDSFVAALLAMTCHLLPVRDFSHLRFPHFQFSIVEVFN
jgi:hypothetical protein